MRFRWDFLISDARQARELAHQLGIDPLLARLLVQRGLGQPETARRFLNPRLEDLHDPFRMKDMEPVVARIFQAKEQRQKILIYGDYDVDGITSTVVLKRALEMLDIAVDYHLPRRLEEGYGMQTRVLRRAQRDGYGLVITADNGIRAFEAARQAAELGLDLIITDHHLPDRELPEACAVLNPLQKGCGYPEKNLAAVGVIFKLVQALFRRAGREKVIRHFLKLVAIGTIADSVPVTGENRIIVRFGLEGLSDPRNPGLKALLEGAGVRGTVSFADLGFRLAPRINAVTRMGGGREVVELFSVRQQEAARRMVEEMNQKNARRQQEEQQIVLQIEERIRARPEAFQKKFLVLAGRDWHRGVIGIVASRMAERFHRPVLVLSVGEENCQGSGRSIPGYNLVEALDQCRQMFTRYGGHAQAAGCTLDRQMAGPREIEELAARLDAHAGRCLTPEQLVPVLPIDALLPPEGISLALADAVHQLAPFGTGNPLPVFACRAVPVAGGPWVLKEKHLKLQLQCNGSRVDAIWWKNGGVADAVNRGGKLDVAFNLSRDRYQGEDKLLLTIRDLHLPA